jgi:hypothetical protein
VGQIVPLLPANAVDILNPDMLALYRNALEEGEVLDACRNGTFVTPVIEPLCDAFLDASLLGALENDISFPLSICHSPDDDLVTFAQVPDLNTTTFPDNIQMYEAVLPGLAPQGGHSAAFVTCVIDPVFTVAFANPGNASPTFMRPLMMPPPQCLPNGEEPSETPTEQPSETPSEQPSETPSEQPSDSCAPLFDYCDSDEDCCSGGTCVLRFLGNANPRICSSISIRNRPKNSVAGSRGGQAGKVKAGAGSVGEP